jgi:hypothetical protein
MWMNRNTHRRLREAHEVAQEQASAGMTNLKLLEPSAAPIVWALVQGDIDQARPVYPRPTTMKKARRIIFPHELFLELACLILVY